MNPIRRKVTESVRVDLGRGLADAGLFPFFTAAESPSAPRTVYGGVERINLGSNNYLGLADDAQVVDAAVKATLTHGSGLTGSRLMNGNSEAHDALEEQLCRFTGFEAALVFPTGYTANLGAMTGLADQTTPVLADTDVHASLYDGIAMAGAPLIRFRHNSMAHLNRRFESAETPPAMLVVDGVYSMRGDTAPLDELVEFCHERDILLLSDEAHGIGVLGATGAGAVQHYGVADQVDLVTCTFSKSLASCGGAVLGDRRTIEHLRITSRPFLFTASNTPSSVAAASKSLELLIEHPEWPALVRSRARYLADKLASRGIPVGISDSAVLTVPVGGELEVLQAWRALFNAGVFTNPVLAPAVQPGHELLRLSVMRTHTEADLDAAAEAFCAIEAFVDTEGVQS